MLRPLGVHILSQLIDAVLQKFMMPHAFIKQLRQLRQLLRPEGRFFFHRAQNSRQTNLIFDPVFEERLSGFPQIELRIELTADAFDVEQRFLQQHQLRLHFHIEAARGAEQVKQHMAERDLRQRLLEDGFAHGTDSEFEIFDVGIGRHPA